METLDCSANACWVIILFFEAISSSSENSPAVILDTEASADAAQRVAELVAGETGQDGAWVAEQVEAVRKLADA